MQKSELITHVAQQSGVSKKVARQVLETALAIISERLVAGEKVVLTGFGTFELRQRQARRGVNPQTRREMAIPATALPGFSASTSLRERIQQTRSARELGK